MNDLSPIKVLTDAVHPLPDEDWKVFSEGWTGFSAKRKEIITAAGEKEKYLYVVLSGVQRIVYYDDDKEATLIFTYPPSFGGVLDSLMMQKPSAYFYEALTPSVFLRLPYEKLEQMMRSSPDIEFLVRKGITGALSGLLERLVELQSFSSEEKFKKLLQRSPHILQLVAHKYLANYLGMDATNFSKLMNRIRL
ncbi:MAG: Crp/Fnr family transcriptional regulator [Chitinophagaceae bacterium]|nr:Crp/Fnr family transcriptional regulator [Chitinophagaceae bacterium]MCW5929343.1 Crp/Fnr family transcriptional regulator [Chitinophagaceae bacterium]